MRQAKMTQNSLFCQQTSHPFSRHLQKISDLLDQHPEFIDWVHEDLVGDGRKTTGAKGMTSEQVLRAAILKQSNEWTYEFLAVQCVDSEMSRAFMKLDFDEAYRSSALQSNISRISASTWVRINDAMVCYAASTGLDRGRTVRMDATVIEANIHYPTDSSLLFDIIRAGSDLLKTIRRVSGLKVYGPIGVKTAKKLALSVIDAKNQEERKAPYHKLIEAAKTLLVTLERYTDIAAQLKKRYREKYHQLLEVAPKVIHQANQRIFKGNPIPSNEKIVSIFEPHTDIIVKGNRDIEFGHKIFITAGTTGLVSDCQITDGNPSDSEFFLDLVERQMEIYGRSPRQIAADGGFSSEENLLDAKDLGVSDVCFSKSPGIEIEEMVKSPWVFQKLRDFRAGVEGIFSTLKRAFGLERVTWKGSHGFARYVHSAIAAYNLTLIARLQSSSQQAI